MTILAEHPAIVKEGEYFPQPIEQMRWRFPLAINHVHYVNEDIRKPKDQWACTDPIHVFDFEDGMRMIVSRDSEDKRPQLLSLPLAWTAAAKAIRNSTIHVSASIRENSQLWLGLVPLRSKTEWQAVIIEHLQQISNFVGVVVDDYISDPPKRVLHLWFKEIR